MKFLFSTPCIGLIALLTFVPLPAHAIKVIFDPALRTVSVAGTADPDIVTIVDEGADKIRISISTLGQVESRVFDTTDVALIVVGGEGGDDQIVNTTAVPMSVNGHAGDDTISGGSSNDFLVGGDGNDKLLGNAGNDFLNGGAGEDILIGGVGDDRLYGGPGNDSIGGDDGDDLLIGDDGDDVLAGGQGADQLFGLAGADTLKGDAGNDTADGGIGDDDVDGGEGDDTVFGGLGNDDVSGGDGNDIVHGNDGNDNLNGGLGQDLLVGGPGDDILAGFDGDDRLSGNDGNDGLDGGFGNDQLFGDAGDDDLVGGDGNDLLHGGSGNDFLLGGGGGDLLYGDDDNDRLDGDIIDVVIDGGAGENTVSTERSAARFGIVSNPANDPISSDEDIFRALEKARTVASQISLFFSFRAQKMPEILNVMQVVKQLDMTMIVQIGVQFLGEPNPPLEMPSTFSDEAVRALYLDNVRTFAEQHPKTIVLSPEINILYWINKPEFALFASLYQEAYAVIKEVSPETDVGISLHYTLFRGCEQFEVLDLLGPRDFIGFTTYPIWLIDKEIVGSIEELPPQWWSWMRWAYPNEKIIIAEIGLPNTRNSTPEIQAAFVRRLPELFKDVKPESINWTLLSNVAFYDPDLLTQSTLDFLLDIGVNPDLLMGRLNNMGLHSHSGTPKLSWFEALKIKYDWEEHPVGPQVPLGVAVQDPADLPAICSRFDSGGLP